MFFGRTRFEASHQLCGFKVEIGSSALENGHGNGNVNAK